MGQYTTASILLLLPPAFPGERELTSRGVSPAGTIHNDQYISAATTTIPLITLPLYSPPLQIYERRTIYDVFTSQNVHINLLQNITGKPNDTTSTTSSTSFTPHRRFQADENVLAYMVVLGKGDA